MRPSLLTVVLSAPLLLLATSNGGPYRHTGAFGESGCDEAGCHRNTFGGTGRVTIDVGPYVPGQKQRVRVTINDAASRAWGFQLAARMARNPQQQAGIFAIPENNINVWIHCADGTMQPCNNQLEYVTHTSVGSGGASPSGSPGGLMMFFVDWTAPSGDVGDVVFTAAALGGDGDRGTLGDRAYTTMVTSLFAPSNQPVFREGGVVNGASFTPNGAIASGTIVGLFGDKLAPPGFRREASPSDLQRDGRLPIELNRIGADFFAPGFPDALPAFMLFASDKQLNVQVPALPTGINRVEVQPIFNRGQGANEVRGNRVEARIQSISPGLFTFDGRSAAAVTPSGAPVGRSGQFPNSRPARPGDVIVLFGTGFGMTNPDADPGTLAPGTPAPLLVGISVRIGGLTLGSSDILYAGAAPGFAGLQQFNVRIPNGVAAGDQPIVISVNGIETQPGVILTVQP